MLATKTLTDRINEICEDDGDGARLLHQRESSRAARRQNEFGLLSDQFFGLLPDLRHVRCGPAIVDSDVHVLRPPELLQSVPERRDPGLRFLVTLSIGHQHADRPHLLLRARRAATPPRRRRQA